MRRFLRAGILVGVAGCSSSAPSPAQPVTPHEAPVDAAPIVIDTRPDISLSAPAYRFRFASATRTETWTLWFAQGVAVLNVQPANGALTQYQGSATEGASVAIDVESATANMKLVCKPAKREVEPACSSAAAKPKTRAAKVRVDVLDCFHADFKEPMPFGSLPGIEYVADGGCAGYRLIAP